MCILEGSTPICGGSSTDGRYCKHLVVVLLVAVRRRQVYMVGTEPGLQNLGGRLAYESRACIRWGGFRKEGLTMQYALLLVRLMEELEISEWCYGA